MKTMATDDLDLATRPTLDILKPPAGVDRLDWAESIILTRLGGEAQGFGEMLPGFPLVHRFTPGMYIREIFMPAGSVLTSKVHKTTHPFVISQGSLWVYSDNDGPLYLEAPYTGITAPGTRRLLVIETDTIWTTFHATDLTDVEAIERAILEPHKNPLLPEAAQRMLLGEKTWPLLA